MSKATRQQFKRRLRNARMRGEVVSANEFRSYLAHKKLMKQMRSEENCQGHYASAQDGKICGGCGVHVDALH